MNSIIHLIIRILIGLLVVVILCIAGLGIYVSHYKNPANKRLTEAGIAEKTAVVGQVAFNYAEGPDNGPALLLLHAQTLDWFTYHEVLPALSEKFHVFAVDYPGHGKTTYPANYVMSANQIGSDLAAFIEKIIGEPAFVTGNSSGGLLSVWLASQRPDLVRALVLEDPPLFSSEYAELSHTVADKLFSASEKAIQNPTFNGNFLDYWIENGTAFFKRYAGSFSQPILHWAITLYRNANPGDPLEIAFLPATVQEMLRGLDTYDPRFGAAFHTGSWNEGFDHASALAKIQCPTLLVQANFEIMADGTLDGAMNEEMAKRAVSLIPDCTYLKVDSGHVTNLEIPDQFIKIVDSFFLGEE